MISSKEHHLDRALSRSIPESSDCRRILDAFLADEELRVLQEYANTISIRRLGFNDHGPVHMRQVAVNAIRMLCILRDAGIKTSLETEESGTFDDSLCAVFMAAYTHDIGMGVGRDGHERMSVTLALPFIDRALAAVFPDDPHRRTVIRLTAVEGIIGHMGTQRIHSLEAGLILVADGCDMTKGRARIPISLNSVPTVGDIHKYSANSIEKVLIAEGGQRPIHISVEMSAEVGFFQIEEVLFNKIESSPAKKHIELTAAVTGNPPKKYL